MPRQPIKVHYAGGLRIVGKNGYLNIYYAGYSCCAYGPRAEKIKRDGNQTEDDTGVTCAACLKLIARARENPKGVVGTLDFKVINLNALVGHIEGTGK